MLQAMGRSPSSQLRYQVPKVFVLSAMSGARQRLVETVDLLDSDEETDSESTQDVIELLDSDEEEVIELLGSDDEDDVRIVKVTSPGKEQQHEQKHTIRMYVDGSHRPGTRPFNMAGGIWVPGEALSIARILHGGQPDSCRAELGTIYAAVDFLSTFGLAGMAGRAARAAARAVADVQAIAVDASQLAASKQSAVEVQILTDCQACLDMLVRKDRVKQKYRTLVEAIKQLKAQLPFLVRIFKVKGHSKKKDAHAVGNKRAHTLAYKCDKHQPVCKLPA